MFTSAKSNKYRHKLYIMDNCLTFALDRINVYIVSGKCMIVHVFDYFWLTAIDCVYTEANILSNWKDVQKEGHLEMLIYTITEASSGDDVDVRLKLTYRHHMCNSFTNVTYGLVPLRCRCISNVS